MNEQVREWSENPVTEKLRELVASEIEEIRTVRGLDAFHPFQPERTQELMASLSGAFDTWETLLIILEGDWSYFEEEDE